MLIEIAQSHYYVYVEQLSFGVPNSRSCGFNHTPKV